MVARKSTAAHAARSKTGHKLLTERQGRLYAIQLLKSIRAISKAPPHYGDQFVAVTKDKDGHCFPPQTQAIRNAFDRIYSASAAARRGFFVVITDAFGMAYTIGASIPEHYVEQEEAGNMDGREQSRGTVTSITARSAPQAIGSGRPAKPAKTA